MTALSAACNTTTFKIQQHTVVTDKAVDKDAHCLASARRLHSMCSDV